MYRVIYFRLRKINTIITVRFYRLVESVYQNVNTVNYCQTVFTVYRIMTVRRQILFTTHIYYDNIIHIMTIIEYVKNKTETLTNSHRR